MKRRIAIVTDDPGWHGARLKAAFAARGCDSSLLSLQACGLDLSSESGLSLPGFDRLPDGVFVRGVPGGSLEQVVLYLDVLHLLKRLGVTVYNDARAIELSVDKGMSSCLLHAAGIPTPAAWVMSEEPAARRLLQRELEAGNELILKPLFGSQGEGLVRLSMPQHLPPPASVNGVYYLQRFVSSGGPQGHDLRVFVVGGRARAAMRRVGQGWINNVARGGRCQPAVLDRRLGDLAEAAAAALSMNYAGVDIVSDARGDLQVIEINSIPAWKGLQQVCPVDIAACLVDDFLSCCPDAARLEAVGG